MVRNRDPFSTALDDLRERLTSGVYGGGAPIVILDEARRLKLSTTPVREALAWLSGAGLVEHVSTGGYRALRIEAGLVRDRYGFRRDCILLGLGNFAGPSASSATLASPEQLFDWIIGRGGDLALGDAYHRVAFQLARLAQAERQVIGDAVSALALMAKSLAEGRLDTLAGQVRAYHQERIAAAVAIAFEADRAPPHPA